MPLTRHRTPATKAGASGWASPRTHRSASVIDQVYPAKPARMLGNRPLSRTTAFAPRRDLKREKPFHQERPALYVASPNHKPKLPILSISYLSRFPLNIVPVPLSPVPLSASCQYRTCPPLCASVPLCASCPALRLLSRFAPPGSSSTVDGAGSLDSDVERLGQLRPRGHVLGQVWKNITGVSRNVIAVEVSTKRRGIGRTSRRKP